MKVVLFARLVFLVVLTPFQSESEGDLSPTMKRYVAGARQLFGSGPVQIKRAGTMVRIRNERFSVQSYDGAKTIVIANLRRTTDHTFRKNWNGYLSIKDNADAISAAKKVLGVFGNSEWAKETEVLIRSRSSTYLSSYERDGTAHVTFWPRPYGYRARGGQFATILLDRRDGACVRVSLSDGWKHDPPKVQLTKWAAIDQARKACLVPSNVAPSQVVLEYASGLPSELNLPFGDELAAQRRSRLAYIVSFVQKNRTFSACIDAGYGKAIYATGRYYKKGEIR